MPTEVVGEDALVPRCATLMFGETIHAILSHHSRESCRRGESYCAEADRTVVTLWLIIECLHVIRPPCSLGGRAQWDAEQLWRLRGGRVVGGSIDIFVQDHRPRS